MYIPAPFRCDDPEIAFALIEEIRFGTLISVGAEIAASHLPFMIDRDVSSLGRLVGHCARANPQWKDWGEGTDVLVTFLGPHTHVSPSWYGTSPRAPTWLYVSVHVRGRLMPVTEPAAVREMAVRLSALMEPRSSAWRPDDVSAYIDKLLPGIVGFHIDILRIETQLRLGQQNQPDDRRRVHRALSGGNLSQQLVARLMERFSFDQTAPLVEPSTCKES